MTSIESNHAVPLSKEPVPTTMAHAASQLPRDVVADAHPYWNAFADGFVKGFSFPFAVLFGMAGCAPQDNPPIIIYDDTSGEELPDAEILADGGVDATTTPKETGSVPEDLASMEVAVVKKEIYSTKPDLGPLETIDAEDAVDSGPDVPADAVDGASELQDGADEGAMDSMTDAAEFSAGDGVADIVAEALADGKSDADIVDVAETVVVQDADAKDGVPDAASDAIEAPLCQYFCDAGQSEVVDTYTPKGDVVSKLCGPLLAPANSVAAACTRADINYMLTGATSCVAECGFFDNKVTLSTAPNTPVAFSMMLFAPPEITKQSYAITLKLNAPKLSNGTSPVAPGFMGSSFVFVFNADLYALVGVILWDSTDKYPNGVSKVVIQYEPYDFLYNQPATLDFIYHALTGQNVVFRYPCDQIVDNQGKPNPIVNCQDVK